MAHNEITFTVPPEAVFDVLADPRSYARWVVGSRAIRAADPDWPARGAVFDHAQGVGPRVQARPVSVAHVTLRLQPGDGGTHVEMEEAAADLRSLLTMNPVTDPLMRLRNAESLRRLK